MIISDAIAKFCLSYSPEPAIGQLEFHQKPFIFFIFLNLSSLLEHRLNFIVQFKFFDSIENFSHNRHFCGGLCREKRQKCREKTNKYSEKFLFLLIYYILDCYIDKGEMQHGIRLYLQIKLVGRFPIFEFWLLWCWGEGYVQFRYVNSREGVGGLVVKQGAH